MNTPKRHHVVPELILKRFADEAGAIFLFDKRREAKHAVLTQPKNALVEAHLYSEINDTGAKDPWLERHYSVTRTTS